MSTLDGTPLVPDTDAPTGVVITHKPAGPLVVDGPVTLLDNEGREIPRPTTKVPDRVVLCGCGLSATKPFCDGAHKR